MEDAVHTYLKQSDAANTYLTQLNAADTYWSKDAANNIFLKKYEAAATYATIDDLAEVASHIVDFVKRKPVFYFVFISGEHGLTIAKEKSDQFSAPPASILINKMDRRLIVAECNQRLHAASCHLIE